MYRAALALVLSLILVAVLAPTSYAQQCDPHDPNCPPPACGDPHNPCTPPPCDPATDPHCAANFLCHNIGGPKNLGANCDPGTGTCTFTTDTGQTISVGPNQFLGIIIGFNQNSAGAFAAHVAHGDGNISVIFNPPLHLASDVGPHKGSNVECLATRIVPQPPDRGN